MNAGAYGGDVATCSTGRRSSPAPANSAAWPPPSSPSPIATPRLPPGAVVVRARFARTPGAPAAIAARMAEIRAAREATQPVRARTGGSTFRNPPDMKAWELIDAAGCRGLTRGGAQVSRSTATS